MLPTPPLEPLSLVAVPTMRERVVRAVGVPVRVAIVVFVAVVLSAIVMAMAQPRTPATHADDDQYQIDETVVSADEHGISTGTLRVHVVGEVHTPGVVELDVGARVEDAIAAAGGVTELAIIAGVNLARPIADGEQLLVPNEQSIALTESGDSGGGKVNVNRADSSALETLSGVGPGLAQRIIDWRESNGSFRSIDQLRDVSGIGQKKLDGFREQVTV